MKSLIPVVHEFLDADVGQRVLQHLHDDLIGHRCDVGTCFGGVGNVLRAADAGGDDLGVNAVEIEDGGDVLHDRDSVVGDVVEPADEGADVGGAGFCREKCLGGAEDQGHVGADAQSGQPLDGFETLLGDRDLDDDVLVNFRKLLGFGNHAVGVKGNHLCADGAVYDGSDLGDYVLKDLAFLGNKGGVSGHTADHAKLVGGADLVDVRGINKEFHRNTSGCFFFGHIVAQSRPGINSIF